MENKLLLISKIESDHLGGFECELLSSLHLIVVIIVNS